MKTKIRNLSMLLLVSGLIAACGTSSRTPAPVIDRATAPVAMRSAGPGEYRVVKGDTLNRIARRFGHRTSDLVAWNNLSNPNIIEVGQILRVQPPGGAASSRHASRPLGASGVNKTTPRGNKQPYSDQAYAAKPAAVPVAAAAASSSAPVANEENGLSWMWPADGRLLATFQGKSKGIDIGGHAGQKVVAAADGQVSYVGALHGFGKLVIVKHSDTLQSVYAHNRTILVKEKQAVTKGQPIAEMGKTDSDIVKLHFEVRRQGKPVDPARFLPAR